MAASLAVAVRVALPKGAFSVGSGAPVAKGLVLTARHVVRPKQKTLGQAVQLFWAGVPGADFENADAKDGDQGIVWEDQELDLALICCRHPEGLSYFNLLTRDPTKRDAWEAEGFPAGAKEKGALIVRSHKGSIGVQSHHAPTARYQVNSDIAEDQWSGMSGAAMLLRGGDRIVGVLVAKPPGGDDRILRCTPIAAALNNMGFRDLVLNENNCDYIRKISGFIHGVICGDRSVVNVLSGVLKVDADERCVVDALVDGSRSLLLDVKAIYKSAIEGEKKKKILLLVLSARLDRCFPNKLREYLEMGGDLVVRGAVRSPVGAEIRMAAFDGRAPEFMEDGGAHPLGRYTVCSKPENGFSQVRPDHVEDLAYRLAVELSADMGGVSPDNPPGSPKYAETLIEDVRRALRNRSEYDGKTYYVTQLHHEVACHQGRGEAERLRRSLPELPIVIRDESDEDEKELLDLISTLLRGGKG